MTRRSIAATAAALATLALLAAQPGSRAGAQAPPPPRAIGEYVHDLYDQRYRPPAERYQRPAPTHAHPAPAAAASQPPGGHQHDAAPAAPGAHQPHGTPAGWKFALPRGDAAKGREVFVKLECYACHEVKGQSFPGVKDAANLGPELSEMAAHHEPEFYAEAIVNPNALIDEPQWRAPDGTSRMPSFNDSLTVQELVDLVAFLKSLTPPPKAGEHKH